MGKRPTSITVIAWILIVTGGIFLITSSASLNNPMAKEILAKSPIPISVQYAIMYVGLLVSVASGIGMLKKQNWARFLYVIWTSIAFLIGLFTSPMTMALMIPGLLFFAIIVFFLFRPLANQYLKNIDLLEDEVITIQKERTSTTNEKQKTMYYIKKILLEIMFASLLFLLSLLIATAFKTLNPGSFTGQAVNVGLTFWFAAVSALQPTLWMKNVHTGKRFLAWFLAVLGGGIIYVLMELAAVYFIVSSNVSIGLSFGFMSNMAFGLVALFLSFFLTSRFKTNSKAECERKIKSWKMKNWLNKLSVWQRIFAILAFGFLIFMIGVWYRAGKEYIIFLVWFVYVAAAYGLYLGVSKIMPLNKLSGWHRIFLVYACTHLVIVVFICAFMPEIVSGSRRRSPGFEDAIGFIFTCGIMPIGLIYGLGRSVGWALKGFAKENYKSEKYKKQKLSKRVGQQDKSYVRSWAEERRYLDPKNLTSRQILFGAMMYGLSRFGKKNTRQSTPPELKSLGVEFDESKHYSGDAALFELGCYMYFRFDNWLFRNKPHRRKEISTNFVKDFIDLFTQALGTRDLSNLFEERVSGFGRLARTGADTGEYHYHLLQLVLRTKDNQPPAQYDFKNAPVIISDAFEDIGVKIALESWEKGMIPAMINSLQDYCDLTDSNLQQKL